MLISIRGVVRNLFLAAIPVFLTYGLVAWCARRRRRGLPAICWSMLPAAVAWPAFLPNACYLITEWRHFLYDPGSRFMLLTTTPRDRSILRVVKHAIFYLGYSGFGVLCFALAVRPLERSIPSPRTRLPIRVGLFFVLSLGVYMGLIVRLNSWDLFARPGFVLSVAARPLNHPGLLATIALFAAILWACYEFAAIWLEGAEARLRSLHRRPIPLPIRTRER